MSDNRTQKPLPANRNAKTSAKSPSKMAGISRRLRKFFQDLRAELRRVVWPDRKKLIQSTATVLAICLIIGAILFFVDTVLFQSLNAMGFYNTSSTVPAVTQPVETLPPVTEPTTVADGTTGTSAAGEATTGATTVAAATGTTTEASAAAPATTTAKAG